MDHHISVEGLALDIDETLANTNHQWVHLLAERFGKPDHLSHNDIIRQWRYVEHMPFWQTPAVCAWMDEARISNEMQETIALIENAHHVVERIRAIVPIAAYITARPECVRQGTLNWLARHGFPEAPVIMRPTELAHESSSKWKADLLAELYPRVRGIVDDNPGLIEHLPEGYQGTIFLYDHPEVARADLNVVLVPTWDDVLAAVSRCFA